MINQQASGLLMLCLSTNQIEKIGLIYNSACQLHDTKV